MLSADAKEKLLKQLEFYFSDSNLPRDKFLRGKTQENSEGWVDLNVICAFTRVARLFGHPGGPECGKASDGEVSQVAALLREKSQQLIVSEDGTRLKRAAPVVALDKAARQADERSLYVAPLPYNVTLDKLTAFFNQEAPVNAVRLRRHVLSKDFKGSVFVEFATQEDATKVAARQLEFEGAPLRMVPKLDFIQQKIDDRHSKAAANGHADGSSANFTKLGSATAAHMTAGPPQATVKPAAATEQSAAGVAAAAAPAVAMDTEAPPQAAAVASSDALKRSAEDLTGGPSAKRQRTEPDGAVPAATGARQPKPDWSDEPATVAHFVFEHADKIPPASALQMLKDSFGGLKAGIKKFAWTPDCAEGYVCFNSEAELDISLSQLAKDGLSDLLAGYPAKITKNADAEL